jgi:hypothetical protein
MSEENTEDLKYAYDERFLLNPKFFYSNSHSLNGAILGA